MDKDMQDIRYKVVKFSRLNDPNRGLQGFAEVLIEPAGIILRGWRYIRTSRGFVIQSPNKYVRVGKYGEDREVVELFRFSDPKEWSRFQGEVLQQIEDLKTKEEYTDNDNEQERQDPISA
jgi:hypothetical protein